jgi:hypothetical protein
MRLETFIELQRARVLTRLEGSTQRVARQRPAVGEKGGSPEEPYPCQIRLDPIRAGYKKLGILYE